MVDSWNTIESECVPACMTQDRKDYDRDMYEGAIAAMERDRDRWKAMVDKGAAAEVELLRRQLEYAHERADKAHEILGAVDQRTFDIEDARATVACSKIGDTDQAGVTSCLERALDALHAARVDIACRIVDAREDTKFHDEEVAERDAIVNKLHDELAELRHSTRPEVHHAYQRGYDTALETAAESIANRDTEIERLRAEVALELGHRTMLLDCTHDVREQGERRGMELMVDDLDAARRERDLRMGQLKGLLARIHRDGGHYTEQHGITKAVRDADSVVAKLHSAASK